MNLYRVTVRGQDGTVSVRETQAASLRLAAQILNEQSKLVKVEPINPQTGEMIGGFYSEVKIERIVRVTGKVTGGIYI